MNLPPGSARDNRHRVLMEVGGVLDIFILQIRGWDKQSGTIDPIQATRRPQFYELRGPQILALTPGHRIINFCTQ